MNIDERLEKLADRHEALTQSVELLRINAEQTDRQIRELTGAVSGLRGFITDVAEGTGRLLRVVEAHEHRLDNHEDRLDNLQG
ncbi:MAG: hypothetical protein ABSE44_03530 [Candidatus Sulfotelmatobacter sp.]|jgi:chromosome segregation ATPase